MKKKISLTLVIIVLCIILCFIGVFFLVKYKTEKEYQEQKKAKVQKINEIYSPFIEGEKIDYNTSLSEYFNQLIEVHAQIANLQETDIKINDFKNVNTSLDSLNLRKEKIKTLNYLDIDFYLNEYTEEEKEAILKIYNSSIITKNIDDDKKKIEQILNKINEKEKVFTYLKNNKYSINNNKVMFTNENQVVEFNSFNCGIEAVKEENKVQKVTILMYHAVDENAWGDTSLFVKTSEFEKQMNYLKENGYKTLFLSEIDNAFDYDKPIIITFDDGYKNVYDNAFPILTKYNLKSNFYIITRWMDGQTYVTGDMVMQMDKSGIVEIGSHTLTHIQLGASSYEQQENELKESKEDLEKLLGKQIDTIAYPYGSYNSNTINITKKYYKYAVTVNSDYNYQNKMNKCTLNRIKIARGTSFEQFKSLVGGNI